MTVKRRALRTKNAYLLSLGVDSELLQAILEARGRLARRKQKLADIEILESNPGAVEDGNIVPRDPARAAPFEHRADCVQNEFAAFDPFANMLEFPNLDRLLRQIAKQPRTLEDLARQLLFAARVGPHASDVRAGTDPFRLEQRHTRWRRGDNDIRLPARLFRRRDMDVEIHTARQQFSRKIIGLVAIARDDMQALQRKNAG